MWKKIRKPILKKDLQLTPVGRHYGTPMYMSPEIALGDESIDSRSDVFALGVILFEMLTLQKFVEGEDIIEIKKKLLEEPLSKPNERVPGRLIPKDLEAVCMKALKKKEKKGIRRPMICFWIFNATGMGKKFPFIGTLDGKTGALEPP